MAAHAEPAPSPAPIRSELSREPATIHLTTTGGGKDIEKAIFQAKLAATQLLLEHLAAEAEVPMEQADPEQLQANGLMLQVAASSSQLVDGHTSVTVRWTIETKAWDDLIKKHRQRVVFGAYAFAPSLHSGVRVVRTSEAVFQPGDRVIAMDGTPLRSLDELQTLVNGPTTLYHSFTVERGGDTVEIYPTIPLIDPNPPPDAPTCGACCHGQCDKDRDYPW